jgi:DNA-binding CsgD family transcriptional regulator
VTTRPERGTRLTARELETARLAAEGLTDRQIAARMSISERTVHAHLRSAYAKTETGTRLRLSIWLSKEAGTAAV